MTYSFSCLYVSFTLHSFTLANTVKSNNKDRFRFLSTFWNNSSCFFFPGRNKKQLIVSSETQLILPVKATTVARRTSFVALAPRVGRACYQMGHRPKTLKLYIMMALSFCVVLLTLMHLQMYMFLFSFLTPWKDASPDWDWCRSTSSWSILHRPAVS